ncbi:PREDICTED: beta-defensin 118 [Chrysochloris asiatica]|uniref:Beta-defensin 118 n=1 Tax=Chrysochloris asiatica TaxID=185453 RepID=A0A9B0WN03_CHRAS|nr:PREDICTED: beta-defensin 118 [Chrysochloris asiatica]
MKLLFLTLAALMFLPLVIPAYAGRKKCIHRGHCRKHCKYNEVPKTTCKNSEVCCIRHKKVFWKIKPELTTIPAKTTMGVIETTLPQTVYSTILSKHRE